MSRISVMFILSAIVVGMLLPAVSVASDGHINYSAPYITVDPKTGKLITVNPGPHISGTDSNGHMGNAGAAPGQPSPQASTMPADTQNSGNSTSWIMYLAGAAVLVLIALTVLAGRRLRRKQLGSTATES